MEQLSFDFGEIKTRGTKRTRYPSGATCSVDGCERPPKGKWLCVRHYTRMIRYGDPLVDRGHVRKYAIGEPCSVEGCDVQADSRGWCPSHYHRWVRTGDPCGEDGRKNRQPLFESCTVDGCDSEHTAKGLCAIHYARKRRYGDPLAQPARRFTGEQCQARGCRRPQVCKGYCDRHYRRLLNYGDPTVVKKDMLGVIPFKAKQAYWSRRRLARKASAFVVDYTAEQVIQKMAYWGNKCWMCSGPFEHVDHVKPLAKGGKDCIANFRPACAKCNGSKNAHWYGVAELHRFVKT